MRKTLAATLVFFAALVFTGVAEADHYEYVAEDPAMQKPLEEGIENWDFRYWAMYNPQLYWWADAGTDRVHW